jgi:hypothetical protein
MLCFLVLSVEQSIPTLMKDLLSMATRERKWVRSLVLAGCVSLGIQSWEVIGASAGGKAIEMAQVNVGVREIQELLVANGYVLVVDGVLGPQTQKAIRHAQRANGIKETGTPTQALKKVLLAGIQSAGSASTSAVRVAPPSNSAVSSTGILGLPFASPSLSGCEEMSFYRQQFGLPEVFDWLGQRESGCRNEASVRTWCCYGYWQNFIYSHLRSPGYAKTIRETCQVNSADDIDSSSPIEKQRSACVTAVLYAVSGLAPWQ